MIFLAMLLTSRRSGKKSAVENMMGIQSTVNTAQQGMAHDAVSRNIADAEADYLGKSSTMGAVSSLAGAGAGMMYLNAVKKKRGCVMPGIVRYGDYLRQNALSLSDENAKLNKPLSEEAAINDPRGTLGNVIRGMSDDFSIRQIRFPA